MIVRKIFGVILLLAIFTLPQSVSATKTDWFDRYYNFHNIRTIIVFDMTINPVLGQSNPSVMRNIQDTFVQNARKLKCNIITEAEARQRIGYQIGMNLEGMAYSNPLQARQIIMQNAYSIADAWVIGNVDNVANNYYIEPARTVWEQKKERRVYYRHGERHEEVYYVQVPVTYPPRRVDVSTLEMTLEVFEARNGAVVFSRRDVRDRNDYQAQLGMYGRITNSFFEDVGKKIR